MKTSIACIITEFSLILLICLFVFYTDQTLSFSRTLLGKLITVLLIIFFTSINILYGLIFCILVIAYYKTDFVEQLLNMDDKQNIEIEKLERDPKVVEVPDTENDFVFSEDTHELIKTNKTPTANSIIQNKITMEEDVVKPKNSNDWVSKIWESVNPYAATPSVGIFSEPFGFYS